MNKLNIFQIEQEYLDLNKQIIESEGELSPELEQKLSITEHSLHIKAINYGFVIKNNSYTSDIIDQEIKRLTALKTSLNNATNRLKDILKNAMILFGKLEIKEPTIKINFRKSNIVEITDSDKVPARFKTIVQTEKIDKNAIKAELKNGIDIPGIILNENQNLQIK